MYIDIVTNHVSLKIKKLAILGEKEGFPPLVENLLIPLPGKIPS